MQKLFDVIFSPRLTLMLLILFAAAIGSATFIEEKYDTITARLVVYDAKWFEIVMLLLVVNFIGIMSRYQLWRKEKRTSLLFHLAFIILIIGAGITRYVGFEGNMHIREGSSSNVIFSAEPSIQNTVKGNKQFVLPFSLYLNNFTLDRYAGSMSPSSYTSEVTLIDNRNRKKEKHLIFMNHVLDYDGYRFFQSSYDMDEKGTVFSVNHDFWGTWISYLGYILLGLGFILTMLNKKSRFRIIQNKIRAVREKRRATGILTVTLILGLSGTLFSQNAIRQPVSAEQADKFGHIIVQSYDGRFEPMHTMAYDVMHKLSRKDHFRTEKGDMDAMQVFLDILIDPVFWKQQKIILVNEKSIQDILGIKGKYASFLDFVEQPATYKLSSYSEIAFRKKPGERNAFDKEILKADERVNIWLSILNGNLLKIFPIQGSTNHTWLNLADSVADYPLTGSSGELVKGLELSQPTYRNIFRAYLKSVYDATKTGDYTSSEKLLGIISNLQYKGTSEKLLPSSSMINLEIKYNRSQIFILLRNCYGWLSIILLLLAFIDNLKRKRSRVIGFLLYFFIALLGIAFFCHSFGMAMRWYLSGHAPWSNGYEALLMIAWGCLLAGFLFIRFSKITVAATALLAFFILMTAGHSSYDPQLTNLQPVLKSYWLVIHVAVITISYGFLGLGFILGLINICLFLFKSKSNTERVGLMIEELTYTNELSLTAGLFLATIGTFLGGVWANESWGNYWGWDAKETWALVIVITYAVILHFRFVPKLKSAFIFNTASILGFGSVLMTFVGVNYYLSKGLHSYAAGEKTVFPLWAWLIICSLVLLIISAAIKEKTNRNGLQ
jgi:cytochrome c-type biogenesis protein CcsB